MTDKEKFIAEIKRLKEPVSDDFDEEVERWRKEKGAGNIRYYECARHFAEWQKEKDKREVGDFVSKGLVSAKGIAVSMAYERGRDDMRMEMMKDAIPLVVSDVLGDGGDVGWYIKPSRRLTGDFANGDKVKVIIIKED